MAERRIIKGWIYEKGPDGVPRPIGPAGGQPPASPTFPLEAPKMQGDIANTNASTNRTVVQTQGDQLDNQTKTRELRNNPIGLADQTLINSIRTGQGDLAGVLKDITAAASAVDRFRPYPGRGVMYGMGTPQDDDYPTTALAKRAVGALLPDKSQEDYQTLLGLQNQSVLNSQIAQKGPQTESDAIRMKLTGVSPNKDVRPNAQLLAEQNYDARMKMNRPGFYETWANNLGSTHALNSKGQTADDVWNQQYQRGYERMRQDPAYRNPGSRSAPRNAPRRPQPRIIEWKDY